MLLLGYDAGLLEVLFDGEVYEISMLEWTMAATLHGWMLFVPVMVYQLDAFNYTKYCVVMSSVGGGLVLTQIALWHKVQTDAESLRRNDGLLRRHQNTLFCFPAWLDNNNLLGLGISVLDFFQVTTISF